jgi:hypothetical protein
MGEKSNKIKSISKCFKFIWIACFVGVIVFWVCATHEAYIVSHDGDYCDFKQTHETEYDFEYPEGNKCDLRLQGIIEPLCAFILFQLIAQIPLWLVYGLTRLTFYLHYKISKK